MFDFLQLANRSVLVFGVANRKSVAWHVARLLTDAGARVIYAVRSPQRRETVKKLAGPEATVFCCDVERQSEIDQLAIDVKATLADEQRLAGIVHSIAYADYSAGPLPFERTPRQAFLQAVDVSCYSLMAISAAFRSLLDSRTGAVVTISISTTTMASENYGYMAPVKAALDSSLCFLAKSFSADTSVRFNAVCPGLLKTSASAGIPNYVDSYLFAEQATLRGQAVRTDEVANAVVFLLSPRSSGMNAQRLIVDSGMSINYFDKHIVQSWAEHRPVDH